MFSFALKNLWTRKSKAILSGISIVMATTIGLLAFNISRQVEDGIIKTVSYYDTLVGPSGSETQLALNTLFFTGSPVGTIEYEYYEKLLSDARVNDAVPFAMGDSYKGSKLVGTESRYLENYKLKDGRLFSGEFEAVIGYTVAKSNNLSIGSTFLSSHGVSENGEDSGHVHNTPYTVVGILSKTNTAYDNIAFINITDVWHVHDHAEDEAHEEHEATESVDGHTEDEHTEEHEEGGVTAILVKTKSPVFQSLVSAELNKIAGIQAINPTTVVREIMENIDLSKQIVYILCFVIGIMAFMIIYIISLLNMHDAKKDIKLMRLLGISKGKINGVLIVQSLVITLISIILSMLLCRILLASVNGFTSSMGIVINYLKFYFEEVYIVAGIVIVSLIPSFIANLKSFRQDPIND